MKMKGSYLRMIAFHILTFFLFAKSFCKNIEMIREYGALQAIIYREINGGVKALIISVDIIIVGVGQVGKGVGVKMICK